MGHTAAREAMGKQSGEREMRWLQDQFSGEDKHEEEFHVRSKPVVVAQGT